MKKDNRLAIFLTGVVLVLSGIIFTKFSVAGPAPQVATEFFDTLKVSTLDAYELTDQTFQMSTSLDDFERFIESYPVLRNVENISYPTRSVEPKLNFVHYTLVGMITDENGQVVPVIIRLKEDADGLQVYGIEVDPQNMN